MTWLLYIVSAVVQILPGAIGAQKTLVLIMAPPGGAYVADQATVDNVMNATDSAYRTASNNQTWFQGVQNPNAKADTFFYTLKTFDPTQCAPFTPLLEAANAFGDTS